ncbi:MAG: extracellular solute-binding protein, partial [Bacilli bacterium]|nr:extracellular solute-binding protein [Bacilli bacterium]
ERSTLALNFTHKIQFTVYPLTAKQEVEFSSSDDSVAAVDKNGVVKGKALGKTTITVRVVADNSIEKSFELTVSASGDSTKPDNIVIQGETEVEEGDSIQLSATVYPLGVSQEVIWSVSDVARAKITENGKFTGLKQGTVYVVVKSTIDQNIQNMIQITIKQKRVEEPYPNLEEYVIKIMVAGHVLHEHDPFEEKYVAVDKQAKQRVWNDVESNFNCELKVVGYPDAAPWGPNRVSWLIEKASINQAEADIFISAIEWTKDLVDGGACWDVTDYYRMYGRNQMNNALKGASTYKGKLYALPSVSIASIDVEMGIFYNVNLLSGLNVESPAKAFNEGRWTYTDFYNYILEVQSRLGEGQYALSGEPSKYWIGMINAGGVKLADTMTLCVNLTHQYSYQAAQILRNIYDENAWDPAADSWELTTSFSEGKSVFQHGEYWFIKTDNRWYEDLWGENTTKFGYVPFPYPDGRLTKSATRTYNAGGYQYMLAKGRQHPANVTPKDIYRAYTLVLLGTKELVEKDPTYDEVQLKRTQAQSRIDDPESVEAIIYFGPDKILFDPIQLLDPLWVDGSLGPALRSIVFNGDDFSETISGHIERIEILLQENYG